jgi:hypothetical protein
VCGGDGSDFNINDGTPETVEKPAQGVTYVLSAWIRTSTPTETQSVQANLRELDAGCVATDTEKHADVVPKEEWQQAGPTQLTVSESGLCGVEVYIDSTGGTGARCFDVDDICVVRAQ